MQARGDLDSGPPILKFSRYSTAIQPLAPKSIHVCALLSIAQLEEKMKRIFGRHRSTPTAALPSPTTENPPVVPSASASTSTASQASTNERWDTLKRFLKKAGNAFDIAAPIVGAGVDSVPIAAGVVAALVAVLDIAQVSKAFSPYKNLSIAQLEPRSYRRTPRE